jgi:intracellular multiplication protein IcmL
MDRSGGDGNQTFQLIIIGLLVAVLFVQLTDFDLATMKGKHSLYSDVTYSGECENKYFASTSDGRIIPLSPKDEPGVSKPELLNWASLAVADTMTFGFNDYHSRLQNSSRYFSSKGWESFTQALERSRIIEMVEANQQVVTTTAQGAPVVLSEGVKEGIYGWEVEVPVVITYQAGARTRTDRLLVRLNIKRSSLLENDKGLAIEQWIATPR